MTSLFRSTDLEQRAVGGGPSLLPLLSRNPWGGNHYQFRALWKQASQVRAIDVNTDVARQLDTDVALRCSFTL